MTNRPNEFSIRWAISALHCVLILLLGISARGASFCFGQAPVAKLALQPNGKFHAPNVPVRSGEDPWGPAKNLGIAGNESYPIPQDLLHVDLFRQSKEDELSRSASCVSCHTNVGNMHPPNTVALGCVDCNGGNPNDFTKNGSHVHPRYP